MKIYADNSLSIGRTPLVRLNRVTEGAKATVLVKIEGRNPAYSVKCRIGASMVWDAEKRGILKPGKELVEPTSGNTGIALAFVAAARGYPLTLTMPETMSIERRKVLKVFGANLVLTEGPKGMKGAVAKAEEIRDSDPDRYVLLQQFENPANPKIHFETTGPEIWEDTEGKVDVFVSGVGTGGTISGVGRYLKEQNPATRIIGAEPKGSGLKAFFDTGVMPEGEVYQVEGIGNDYVPDTLSLGVVDEMSFVDDAESFYWARRIAREEGILVGGSSGTILAAARRAAQGMHAGQTVVLVLCDSGERYLSKFLDDDWMRANGYDPEASFA